MPQPENPPLRVLCIEDAADDAQLMALELEGAGYSVDMRTVATRTALEEALREPWDVVCCDYTLPGFGAIEALSMVRTAGHDVPVILVSGTIGEEAAVNALKAGAQDFVSKSHLSRLVPVVKRELEDAEQRRARRRAEQALNESAGYLSALMDNVADAVITFDPETRHIRSTNRAATRIFGSLSSQVTIDELLPEPPSAGMDSVLTTARRADGSEFPAEVAIRDMQISGKVEHIATLHDVTERRRLERQIEQAQRMETVGHFAGGIAHDFNNILTGIIAYTALARARVKPTDAIARMLDEIQANADRAAALCRQVLALSRGQVSQRRNVDANTVIEHLVKLLDRVLGEDIELDLRLTPDLPSIYADSGQIEQVLMNLCVNARDAMPSGGRLRLSTHLAHMTAPDNARGTAKSYVCVTVEDTGIGMPPELLPRIFDPLFTTKTPGSGSGLGLSVVYGIVHRHDGFLEVQSTPGRGSTFEVYIPAADGPAEAAREPRSPDAPVRGAETLLLVEDEKSVRQALSEALQRLGYTVIEAADGASALERFAENQDRITLAILDVVMPRMDGPTVRERLLEQNPDLPTLFITGYDPRSRAIDTRETPVLQKPFTPAELARKVREVLDTVKPTRPAQGYSAEGLM